LPQALSPKDPKATRFEITLGISGTSKTIAPSAWFQFPQGATDPSIKRQHWFALMSMAGHESD
jgi:hypothetical protein